MKIAIVSSGLLYDISSGVNGTQVQLHNLACGFCDTGMQVDYCAPISQYAIESLDLPYNLHSIAPSKSIIFWRSEIRDCQKVLRDIQPDVIYTRGRSQFLYACAQYARGNSIPLVWGTNGEDSCECWKMLKRLSSKPRSILSKVALFPLFAVQDCLIHNGMKNTTFVLTQTEHQNQRLQENLGKSGEIMPSYYHTVAEQDECHKRNRVLWLANLSRGKQPELFFDLAERCARLGNWEFVLAGGTSDAGYEATLRRRAESIPNLRMMGPIPFDETHGIFADCKLFVNTSKPEADGVPNVFIQSWLAGTPVLSLNHDPNGWISKKSVGVCANGDSLLFLSECISLLADPQRLQQLGKNAKVFALKSFANQATIDRYIGIFGDAIRKANE